VDWYVDGDDQLADLRHEIVAHLGRHAVPGSEDGIADAELVGSEAVGNAIRHTGGPVWVSLSWGGELPVLAVHDVGPGFDPAQVEGARRGTSGAADPSADLEECGRGLLIMGALAPHVTASLKSGAGMVVELTLPVRRQPTMSFDPPLRRSGALPALSEAAPGGGFGKESFLRALVVQLSQAVEEHQGHDAAEAAVAQVGTDVGGQMEAEYRLATEVVGRLTPQQLGECYVRLKHAIDGEFSVVEATAERIVLENTRCPFGDTVRRAPALCRMTSSVFGGIAARNSPHGASVVLEERIAVGDPGCRVVVHLGPPPPQAVPFAHHYRTPSDPTRSLGEPVSPVG
jgi:anti-sigma regulatory factor (Ser/Thr protein kinase)